jgi:Ca2+-binding EF-hand superfamily protein
MYFLSNSPQVWARSIKMLFLSFDADGSGEIDINELASGLSSFGVRFNQQQLVAFRDDISGGEYN